MLLTYVVIKAKEEGLNYYSKKPGSPSFLGWEPGFLSRFFEGFLAQKYFTF